MAVKKGSNQSLIKICNQNLIINEIRKNSGLSRTDIAKKLQLSNPSVSKHVDELLAKGILKETGSAVTDIGRRPIQLEFNADYGYVAVVDLVSEGARICIADMAGNKLHYVRTETSLPMTIKDIEYVIATLREMLASLEDRPGKLTCICIAVPGYVDPDSDKILFTRRIEDYQDLNLIQMFTEVFGVPVTLRGGYSLYSLGEHNCGLGVDIDNFCYLYIDKTFGMSVMIDGKPYKGKHGTACNAGVLINTALITPDIDPNNIDIENIYVREKLNINVLTEQVRWQLEEGRESIVKDWISSYADLTFDDVARAYGMNDHLVVSIIRKFTYRLAAIMYNLTNLFDTEAIIIGGAITKLGAPFVSELNKVHGALRKRDDSDYFKLSQLQNAALIHGGISVAVQCAIDDIVSQS